MNAYGWISITLHWLMAIALVAMFALGTYMVDLDYYDSWYHRAPEIHKSSGILLVITMMLRLIWNVSLPRPQDLTDSELSNKLGHMVHRLFYLLILLLFISGYLISTAKGKGIAVFDFFSVPAFLAENPQRGEVAGDIHGIIAWSFISLVLIHVMAALYHHFIVKDEILVRMLGIKNKT